MTRVLIDADACPVIDIAERICIEHNIELILFCDTNHLLSSSYAEVIVVGAGTDAVDFKLVNSCNKGDIVISQDYGVAAMALGKGAYCINQNGKWYTNENIDQLLFERHIGKKARRSNSKSHIKGPKKRTEENDLNFERSFRQLVEKVLGR